MAGHLAVLVGIGMEVGCLYEEVWLLVVVWLEFVLIMSAC